jgi:hypothetical protein
MKIQISGIKSLKEFSTPINFNRLTFITGKNSSGKSSFTSGLNFLSNVFENHNISSINDLFFIKIRGHENWIPENLDAIMNGNAIRFGIRIDSIFPLDIILNFSKNEDGIILDKLECLQESKLIYFINRTKQPTTSIFNKQLITGNLDEKIWQWLDMACNVHLHCSSDNVYRQLVKRYYEQNKMTIDLSVDLDNYFENFDNKLFAEFTSDIGKELLLITSIYAKQAEPSEFKKYVKNKFVDKSIFNEIKESNELKLAVQINEIFLPFNPNNALSFPASALQNESEIIKENINCNIVNLMLESMEPYTKEYLKQAEGLKGEIPIFGSDESYQSVTLNSNCRAYLLSNIINEWIKLIAKNAIIKISEFQFDRHMKSAIKNYFSKDESPQIYQTAKFFCENEWSIGLLKTYLEYLDIGKNVIFEKHMYGQSYMIFITDNNDQKINIAQLGSGHYYVFQTLLILVYKIHLRDVMIIENESELANHGKLVESETEDDLNEVEDFLQNEQTIKLILTEPETNLHPDLQTKFCKLIIHIATDFNVSFMIETHSEYFIRSLELELASKKTKKSKINIYYFENIKGKGTKIKPIGINEFGLTKNEFGSGFLDESQKTIENILKIKEN